MYQAIKPFWGSIHQVNGASPAVATKFTSVKIPNHHHRIRAIKFQRVTDANAPNRHPFITFQTGGGMNPFFCVCDTALTASKTWSVCFNAGGHGQDKVGDLNVDVSMPYDLHFPDDWEFEILVENIQAADQIQSISLFYDLWPEGTVAPSLP